MIKNIFLNMIIVINNSDLVYIKCLENNQLMSRLDLNEQEIKMLIDILRFSITACPLSSISKGVEIDADMLEKLISKMENTLK